MRPRKALEGRELHVRGAWARSRALLLVVSFMPPLLGSAGASSPTTLLASARTSTSWCTSPPAPSPQRSGVPRTAAAPAAAVGAEIALDPYLGPQGTDVTVTGGGFHPGEEVTVQFDGVRLGSDTASGNGTIAVVITVPLEATPGLHPVAAKGQTSGDAAVNSFWVRNNWRQYLGNSTHTSSMALENVLDRSNAHSLREVWTAAAGRVGGAATLWNRALLAVVDGRVLCMARDDGSLQWSMSPADGPADGTVAVEDFVAFVTVPSAGEVLALGTPSGQVQWKVRVGDAVEGSPSTSEGVVYFGSDDHRVYAVSSSSGKILWSAQTGGPVRTTPAAEYEVVFATSADGGVYALNADRGSVKWTATVPAPGDPVKEDGTLYVPSGSDSLYALSAADGQLLWKRTVGDDSTTVVYPPAVAGGELFVTWSGPRSGGLTALDADTGRTDWAVPASGGYAPAVANGVVFAGGPPSAGGRAAAYDAVDGDLLWVPPTGGGHPIEADATVYTTGLSVQGPAIYAEAVPGW